MRRAFLTRSLTVTSLRPSMLAGRLSRDTTWECSIFSSAEFEECSGREIALETRLLLENLEVENAMFLSDHVSNYLPLYGKLPGDKDEMIAAIDRVLAQPDPSMLKPRTIRSL